MPDRFSFNLLNEPWIACLKPGGKLAGELGIRETLERAHDLQEIATSSPLATISLYRLLIAVLHSALDGPKSSQEWGGLWDAGRFKMEQFDPYLTKWEPRFDLFDETFPFYQRADLEEVYSKSIIQIVHELPADGGAVFLDHITPETLAPFTTAEAARALVAVQTFSAGGLISLRKGEDPLQYKSADGSPIFKCAVTLVRGKNLFETLLLNVHRYSRIDGAPMPARNGDRPAWERDEPTEAEDRLPDGYRDLLTWQSRRARVIPQRLSSGSAGVSRVVLMKGNQFPDGFELAAAETMVPFRKNNDPKATVKGWTPLTIRRERALWRESAAIFQQAATAGETAPFISRAPAKMLRWLATLKSDGVFAENAETFDVEVFGIESDRASLSAWRQESLPLPQEYLDMSALTLGLEWALQLTEDVNRELRWTVERFAERALAPQSDEGGRQADRDKGVKPLRDAIDVEAAYWPFLEAPFLEFLRELPSDCETAEDGRLFFGKASLAQWGADVNAISGRAMRQALSSGGTSARMLKAAALSEGYYRALIQKRMADYQTQTARGVEVESLG